MIKKIKKVVVIGLVAAFVSSTVIALSDSFAIGAVFAETTAVSGVLSTAQKKYGVKAENIYTANTPETIESTLAEAGTKASEENPYIVYVPAGNYKMLKKLTVPDNVTLVAEKRSVFEPATDFNFTQFFMVYGNVYGGTYECKKMAYYGLRFGDVTFQGNNGIIERTNVHDAKRAGIIAIGANTRFAYVYYNNVSGCGNSGISAVQGAWIAIVSGNKCTGNIASGVNLGHANINIIKNNVLTGNTGHGISTDIDGDNVGPKYCHIHKIMNNVITDNGVNGVYIDENCYVDVIFSRNNIRNNGKNGLSVDSNAYVNTMAKNTFDGNNAANINVSGKNANVYIGNTNVITNAKTNNISITDAGRVTIFGKNNVISNASAHGISVNTRSALRLTGMSNEISENSGFGIRLAGNSAAKMLNTTFSKNKGFAVKVEKGSKMTYDTTSNISEDKAAENRIYFEK